MRIWNILPLLVPFISALTVLQLADFHMDVDYSVKGSTSEACHYNSSAPGNLGYFGDYLCDSPESLVAYTVKQAYEKFPNPDLILWTGDNIPHIENYTWQYVFNSINITTSIIRRQYPNALVVPTFGNHDYAPSNAFDQFSTLYNYTWTIWKQWIPADQKSLFIKYGYYKYTLPTAIILVLNTNLYYNSNTAYSNFSDPLDPSGMFRFMENELSNAASCKNSSCISKINIVAHIPPGAFERTPYFVWFRPEYNERFLNITIRYADNIRWMIYGHHHTDTFHLVKNSNGDVVQLSIMAPAVTPWFSPLNGAGANNPSFRVYDLDNDHNILDIRTFYVNLSQLNENPNMTFQLEYSFKKAYDLPGFINYSSMDAVLQQMKYNDSVFAKYIAYNSVMHDLTVPTGDYRRAQLCAIEFSDYPRYNNCMIATSTSSKSFLISFAFPALSVFCYLFAC